MNRLEQATQLAEAKDPDYEKVFGLFDMTKDSQDPKWLNLIGFCLLSAEGTRFHNPKLGFELIVKAAEAGHTSNLEHIAMEYAGGSAYQEIDMQKAAYWTSQAIKAGSSWDLLYKYTEALNSYRFSMAGTKNTSSLPTEITDDAFGMIWNVEGLAKPYSMIPILESRETLSTTRLPKGQKKLISMNAWQAAVAYGSGRLGQADDNLANRLYDFSLRHSDAIPKDVRRFISRGLLIRFILGLGEYQGSFSADELLEKARADKCRCDYIYNMLSPWTVWCKNGGDIRKLHYAHFFVGDPNFRNNFRARDIIESSSNPRIVDHAGFTEVGIFMAFLAHGELWRSSNQWRHLRDYLLCVQMQHSYHDMMESTMALGPMYNPISDDGLPIIGEYEARHYGGQKSGELIERGKTSFRSLTGSPDGDIHFEFVRDPELPSFITDEDIDVALVLAFGYKDFQWPEISMESLDFEVPIERKQYSHPWLADTDFGRTLYTTDFLAGSLAWNPGEITVSEKSSRQIAFIAASLSDMVKKLEENPRHPWRSINQVVNINPKDINLTIDWLRDSAGRISRKVNCHGVHVGIDGGYIIRKGGQEESWKYRNSKRYTHGKVVRALTERYDDIAMILPVYERLRQLMGLTYSLYELKKSGFQPSQRLSLYIQDKKTHLEQYSSTQLLTRIPLQRNHKEPTC